MLEEKDIEINLDIDEIADDRKISENSKGEKKEEEEKKEKLEVDDEFKGNLTIFKDEVVKNKKESQCSLVCRNMKILFTEPVFIFHQFQFQFYYS